MKPRHIYLFLFFYLLVFVQCKKKDDLSPSENLLWRIRTMDVDNFDGNISPFSDKLFHYNNIVVVPAEEKEQALLYGIDVDSGEVLWKWDPYFDWIQYYPNFYFGSHFTIRDDTSYLKDNLLSFVAAAYQYDPIFDASYVFTLDIETGKLKTVSKMEGREIIPSRAFAGLGDYYYCMDTSGDGMGRLYGIPYRGNIHIPQSLEKVADVLYTFAYAYYPVNPGRMRYSRVYDIEVGRGGIGSDGEEYLVIEYDEPESSERFAPSNTYVVVYNLTQHHWVREPLLMDIGYETARGAADNGFIVNGKYYTTSQLRVSCVDLQTGELLWHGEALKGGGGGYNRLLYAEGKIIASVGISNLRVYDADNGKELYQLEGSGATGAIGYLNGIVYYVCLGDAQLRAVELSSGKVLWRTGSPDYEAGDTFWKWGTHIGVIPGRGGKKGRIVATTYRETFCYEAIR